MVHLELCSVLGVLSVFTETNIISILHGRKPRYRISSDSRIRV